MPRRITPLINEGVYHVFNRGINKQTIYLEESDKRRFLDLLQYYQPSKVGLCFSDFKKASEEKREISINKQNNSKSLVDILSYCLMPNHFHLVLKQTVDNGISEFMRKIQIGYTKYFNKKYEKDGPILRGQFKSVNIENEDLLQHIVRYIHLNPYSSNIVDSKSDLFIYPWSSLSEYIDSSSKPISKPQLILKSFKSVDSYRKFILNQADYQKNLNILKHLIFED